MRAAALLMALLMLTAGCLGMGGDDAEGADAETDGNTTDQGTSTDGSTDGNATDGAGDHGHEPEPERHWDNRTGQVEGSNVVVSADGAAEEQIQVPGAAFLLGVNLTAEEGEIDAQIYPPGCEEQDDEPGEDCSTSLSTKESNQEGTQPNGGSATWETQDPKNGTWTVRMWKGDAGTSSVPYTLALYYDEEHEPAPGHHS